MRSSAISKSATRAPAESLTRYLAEISAFPLLTREQEAELSRRILDGDERALHELICANLRFVVAIAKRYRHHGVPMSDLINEGNIGLMRAAERFDHDKGVRFVSYAVWWIRQAMMQALSENAHTVRIPVHRAGAIYRLSRRVESLRQQLGREPTQRELTTELHLTDSELEQALPVAQEALSLDQPVLGEGDSNLFDLVSNNDDATDESLLDDGMTATVRAALASLRPREGMVVRLYFGFDGGEPMTLEAIGAQLGITRERVRQIKERALARIRRCSCAAALASLAESE